MFQLPKLANEFYSEIFFHLDVPSALNVYRASTTFHELAKPRLYHHISLSDRPIWNFEIESKLLLSYSSLNKKMIPFVRKVELRIPRTDKLGNVSRALTEIKEANLLEISVLGNVPWLKMEWRSITTPVAFALSKLMESPAVLTIQVHGFKSVPLQYILSQKKLRRLTTDSSYIENATDSDLARLFPRLCSLNIDDRHHGRVGGHYHSGNILNKLVQMEVNLSSLLHFCFTWAGPRAWNEGWHFDLSFFEDLQNFIRMASSLISLRITWHDILSDPLLQGTRRLMDAIYEILAARTASENFNLTLNLILEDKSWIGINALSSFMTCLLPKVDISTVAMIQVLILINGETCVVDAIKNLGHKADMDQMVKQIIHQIKL